MSGCKQQHKDKDKDKEIESLLANLQTKMQEMTNILQHPHGIPDNSGLQELEVMLQGYLFWSAIILGGTGLYLIVANKYTSYVQSKRLMDESEAIIQMVQKIPEHRRDSETRNILDKWEKIRESTVSYMKKNKLIGKLVEIFPPKNYININ